VLQAQKIISLIKRQKGVTMSTEDTSRKAKFEAAKQKRKEEQENKGNGYSIEYEKVDYVAIEKDTPAVFRIFGLPPLEREKGSDPKTIALTYFKDDKGKMMRVIFPTRAVQKDWILWEVYDKVLEYKWNNTLNQKDYKHDKTHPVLFNRVAKDNSTQKLANGWRPKEMVLMNVIDRNDPEFHAENKHSKVLSKGSWEKVDSDGISKKSYNEGIPNYAYNTIWDSIVGDYGDWMDYDIQLKSSPSAPYYFATVPREGVYPLTEEEKAYELYDFDKLFKVTSYSKIFKRLGGFIKQVDAAFGTNFLEELKELTEIESAERKANNEADEDSEETNAPEEKKTETPETPKPAVTEEAKPASKRRGAKQEEKKTTIEELYPYYSELSDEEKACITGLDENGKIIYNVDPSTILGCCEEFCECEAPETFSTCPACGIKFDTLPAPVSDESEQE
jgi:hypothetical protein